MQDVGYAALQIIPSFKNLDRNLEAGTSKAMLAAGNIGGAKFGDAAGRTAGQRFGRMFATTAKAGLIGVGALGALAFKVGKDSVGLASDLNESLNAVNVTYEKQAIAVQTLGRQAAESLGLSNIEFNNLAVRFSAFSKTIAGGEGPQVVKVLDDLTTRASDFASVMNLEVNEAAELFQSGLAGETEPLRKFGIDLSAAAVEAHAYATGIADAGDKLTEAEKVQARYSLLMKQTTKTQGDFANTSDQLANQQRILNARWDDARAKLGVALLPMLTDVTGYLLDEGIPAFERFSEWFRATGGPAIYEFIEDAKPLAKELLPEIGDALKTVGGFAKDAAGYADDLVSAFNDMPDWAKTAIIGGGAGLYGMSKLGLGGVASKGVGAVLSSAKPVPVFVTNPGFGAPGGKGIPPVVPGGVPKPGALPKYAPFIPVGLDSAPGQDSLLHQLTGVGLTSGSDNALEVTAEMEWKIRSDQSLSEFAEMKLAAEKLPEEVTTTFVTRGVPQSRAEVRDLVREFDLTPKQKQTLFAAAGVESAKQEAKSWNGILDGLPELVKTLFRVDGVETARQSLATARRELEALDGNTYRAVMELHTVRTGPGGQGGGYNGAADGATVPGARYPYGDRVPYLLAPGEEVISNRYGQADRNRALLKAINANRLADGGTVGRTAVAGERVVERLPMGPVRLVIDDGTTLTARFEQVASGREDTMGARSRTNYRGA